MTTQTLLPPSLFHRRHTEGKSFWGPGDIYTFLVTGEESEGAYFSMLATVPPQGGPPPHIHLNEDETFYVLDGTPTFRLADELVVAGPGDFVNVPKGVVHCFRNFSDEPLRMILTFTPAGHRGVLRGDARARVRPHAALPRQPRRGGRPLCGGGSALRAGVFPRRVRRSAQPGARLVKGPLMRAFRILRARLATVN